MKGLFSRLSHMVGSVFITRRSHGRYSIHIPGDDRCIAVLNKREARDLTRALLDCFPDMNDGRRPEWLRKLERRVPRGYNKPRKKHPKREAPV